MSFANFGHLLDIRKATVYTVAMDNDGLVSQQQAAALLGVSRQRVNQLMAAGVLTPVSLAGKRILMLHQVMRLVERRNKARAAGSQ